MKLEDFCRILRSKTGKSKVLAYEIFNIEILSKYFEDCNYKPAILAEKLNIHYQSTRKLLQDANLWKYVRVKNGKGSGVSRKRFKQTDMNGYLYSDNPDNVKYTSNRCRRTLKHIEVMEYHLGRSKLPGEIIHHIDENKKNNDISNLYLCSKQEHGTIHKQLESLAAILVQEKLIVFENGKYKFSNIFCEQFPIIAKAKGWV